MKRAVSILVAFAILVTSAQFTLLAAQTNGEISGTAVVEGKPLPNVTVRVRNVDTKAIFGTMTTNTAGEYKFTGVPAGNYVVEVVDDKGNLLGMSARISLVAGAMIAGSVTVSTSAAAAAAAGVGAGAAAGGAAAGGAAAGAAAGGSFFASTLGIVTVAAGAAGLTTAAVAAKKDASPKS